MIAPVPGHCLLVAFSVMFVYDYIVIHQRKHQPTEMQIYKECKNTRRRSMNKPCSFPKTQMSGKQIFK